MSSYFGGLFSTSQCETSNMRMLTPEGGQRNVWTNHNKGSMETQCEKSHALVRKTADEFIGLVTLFVIDQDGTHRQSYGIVIDDGKISLVRHTGVTWDDTRAPFVPIIAGSLAEIQAHLSAREREWWSAPLTACVTGWLTRN